MKQTYLINIPPLPIGILSQSISTLNLLAKLYLGMLFCNVLTDDVSELVETFRQEAEGNGIIEEAELLLGGFTRMELPRLHPELIEVMVNEDDELGFVFPTFVSPTLLHVWVETWETYDEREGNVLYGYN